MLGLTNLTKSFGGRTLFQGVSLQLNAGCRYGVVGANGSGKTTLLRILAGDDPHFEGHIALPKGTRVGVLRQDRFLDETQPIVDVAMRGDAVVWEALRAAEREPERAHDFEEILRHLDGYTLRARASAVLEGLGIPVAQHEQPLGTLSGGFKLRVLLAQVLLGRPELLLLDEPTNHLDILSIRWLEKFLARYEGCALVVSHDHRFLDNVATHILDVDYQTITPYTGGYSSFVVQKQATRERMEAEHARMTKLIEEKKAFIERFRAKATKARQAQSRAKQVERLAEEIEEVPETTRRTPRFRFVPARQSGREVLTVARVSKAYGDKQVLRDVSLVVRRAEKVAVIGPNGLGKSTLLKIAVGALAPDVGTATWGHEVRVGYFAQDHHEVLRHPKQTPLAYIEEAAPQAPTSWVRGQLGQVLFTKDEVHKPIGALSGGEAARLVFCRLSVEQPNVLVLDEPTNHLDLESIEALAQALRAYEGTLIFVSHDRWFVSEVATRIVEITPTGLRDFPGTYTEYLERLGDDHLDADAVVLRARNQREEGARASAVAGTARVVTARGGASATDRQAAGASPTATSTRDTAAHGPAAATRPGEGGARAASGASPELAGSSWEEQKRLKNRLKNLPKERDELLAVIERLEARKKELEARYCEEGFYERTPVEQQRALQHEIAELARSVDALMAKWEAVEAELARYGLA
jgi:ATPase subunit of ABC transporter with duplicated ATPase domains